MSDWLSESIVELAKALGILLVSAFATFSILDAGLFKPGHGQVKDAVSAQLRDPSSAQFREIFGTEDTYCGEVNGKNGFGAYSGFRKFVYRDGSVLFEPDVLPEATTRQQSHYYEDLARFARLQGRVLRIIALSPQTRAPRPSLLI